MQPPTTDIDPLPRRWRNLLPFTRLSTAQVQTLYTRCPPTAPTRARPTLGTTAGRAGAAGANPPTHQPDHPGAGRTVSHQPISGRPHPAPPGPSVGPNASARPRRHRRALDHRRNPDPPCTTSQSPPSATTTGAASTRKSSSAPTRAASLRSGAAGPATATTWSLPAQPSRTHLLTGQRVILGDGGYRAIPTIITPARDRSGRIICDDNHRAHRQIRARVEHVLAPLKDWQIPRQCRRRGHAINHSLHIIAGLWNIKTHNQLRVTS
jgi:hypothetical protein